MPTRKNDDGSFRRLPNGSVEFTVSIGFDSYGKHRRKRFYGKTESECRKKYKAYIKEEEKSQPQPPNDYTLAEWFDVWLVTYKKGKVQEDTYNDYCIISAHAVKHIIGNMKLSQIKPIHITEFFSDKSEYSHSIIKRLRFLLNGAFECAIENDFCDKNPVRRAEIPKKTQTSKEAFTEDEVKTIIEFSKTDELFGTAMYIMLNTGIRSGEMRALTIEQIDFENGIICIDRAVKHTEELGKPKNGKTRYIPLESDVLEFLAEKIDRNVKYLVGDSCYVSRAGFRSRYQHFFNRLNKHLQSKGETPIEYKSPHSSRHTFGTIRQKNGMPIAMVSELLGHSSTDVTDKYTHLGDVGILAEAVRKYPFLNESV
jgi:integrase